MHYVTITHTHSISDFSDTLLWCIDNLTGESYLRYVQPTSGGILMKKSTRIHPNMTQYMNHRLKVCSVEKSPDLIYLSFAFRDEGDAMMFSLRFGSEPENKNVAMSVFRDDDYRANVIRMRSFSLDNLHKSLHCQE